MPSNDRRLLLVHAHPDDETISNAATMAKYVDEGAQVTLVTCTLGEEGEILVPGFAHLAADRDDALGLHRLTELEAAMNALGVTDHRFLGGPGHFRDSGMKWDEQGNATAADDTRPDTFWHADLTEAANLLVEIIRETKPQVLVTYDEFGGYGHPDHVQAHRVAMYAAALAAVPSYRRDLGDAWDIAKIYWTAVSATMMREGLRALRAAGDETTFAGMDPDGSMPRMVIDDDDLTARIDASPYVDAKMAAMRAHETQIAVDGPFFALSNNAGNQVWGIEYYRIAKGEPWIIGANRFEEDLFGGL